jgi:hypothetical protein
MHRYLKDIMTKQAQTPLDTFMYHRRASSAQCCEKLDGVLKVTTQNTSLKLGDHLMSGACSAYIGLEGDALFGADGGENLKHI